LAPQTDGSIVFARWRQCALASWHIGTTWRIGLNWCFLQPTRVHNPNGKSIGSAVSAKLTAESIYFIIGDPSHKIAELPVLMGIWTHLIHHSLGQSEPTIQTASRSVQLFSHRWPQSVPILYNGTPLPPQNCPFPCGIWTPSNSWFPGPTRVLNPNGKSIDSAVLQGSLVWQTDRQTTRYSVGNNRPHLRT